MNRVVAWVVPLILVMLLLAGCGGSVLEDIAEQGMIHNNAGVDLAEEGKYQEAIAEYDEAIRLIPGLAQAYIN
ncbi:MAG: tetratricopeptide repeat protein, partial [Dehalococcoidia bacterium]